MGTGISKIKELCEKNGNIEPLFQFDSFYSITFKRVSGGISDLLLFIKNNPGSNTAQLKKNINVPQRTLERLIKKLKDENKIVFKGSPKTGGYFAKEDK